MMHLYNFVQRIEQSNLGIHPHIRTKFQVNPLFYESSPSKPHIMVHFRSICIIGHAPNDWVRFRCQGLTLPRIIEPGSTHLVKIFLVFCVHMLLQSLISFEFSFLFFFSKKPCCTCRSFNLIFHACNQIMFFCRTHLRMLL